MMTHVGTMIIVAAMIMEDTVVGIVMVTVAGTIIK